MKNATIDRFNYNAIKKEYIRLKKGNVRLTQSDIFLTQAIDSAKSTYNFDILNNDNTNGALQTHEIRLNQNDEFITTSIGIFLYCTQTDGGGVVSPMLLTYAPIELDKVALKSDKLYAGIMRLAVNNIVYTEKWNVRKHRMVPRTEFASMPTPAAGPPVISNSYPATWPSIDNSEDGFISLAPLLTFSGAKKNEISINLPNGAMDVFSTAVKAQNQDSITIASTRIAIWFRGLLAQNASSFQGVTDFSNIELR